MTDGPVTPALLTVRDAIGGGTARLRASGSPSPRLDAELLVAHAVDRDRAWLLAHPEVELEPDAAARLASWIDRRAAGEPIAYIRGFKEWLSLRLRTDPRALIPRPETELLAEAAIAEVAARMAQDDRIIVAWDLATGGGAVAVALALRFRTALALERVRLIASDRSPEALELAAENLGHHGVADRATLACSDLLDAATASLPAPDVLVANLPYLTSDEVARGSGSIAYEPSMALDGGADGLDLIRATLAQLPTHAAPGATVLLEVGAGQADAVRSLVPAAASVSTMTDLAGLERVVRIDLA